MNKRLIPLLITSISIAIIGLITVQIYWINSAITLKQEEFKRNAAEALNTVVDQLEKDETLSRLRSHKEAQFLFFDEDTLTELNQTLDELSESLSEYTEDTLYEHIVFKEILKDENRIEISITEDEDGKRVTRHISTDSEADEWSAEEKDIIEEHIALKIELEQSQKDLHHFREVKNIDSLVKQKMVHKTAFVGDIVKRLIEVNLFEDIGGRIDENEIDSLLQLELTNRGITTSYEFGVYLPNGDVILQNTEEATNLKKSTLKTKLFPNDIVDSNSFLKIHFPRQNSFLVHQLWWMLCSSIFIVFAIIVVFFYAVRTIISQKEVSEIKNDFINNMTHELKTPISTISLACEALSDDTVAQKPGIYSKYINMINDENKRLGLLVESVLQSAIFDKGSFKLNLEQLDMHQIITGVVTKLEMQAHKRDGQVTCNLSATDFVLKIDRVHLSNVVSNLIDNAIKYAEDAPKIVVDTESTKDKFRLSVSDNGIGISSDNQKKIFDKLYRVPTGNVHNAKGFGLGLSYVKTIVDRHNGVVSVKSSEGKGSTFTIEFPIKDE
jgi:two-component system, OmpR family, phosphate regulon sensor histidine kinase PhoR